MPQNPEILIVILRLDLPLLTRHVETPTRATVADGDDEEIYQEDTWQVRPVRAHVPRLRQCSHDPALPHPRCAGAAAVGAREDSCGRCTADQCLEFAGDPGLLRG